MTYPCYVNITSLCTAIQKTALLAILLFLSTPGNAADTIWFTPPSYQNTKQSTDELAKLIRNPASWNEGLQHVQVFKLYIFALNNYSDQTLTDLFHFLSDHHIDLALEAPVLTLHDAMHCGWDTEGYGFPEKLSFYMSRLRSLGADLQYLAMDEPLFYGHDVRPAAGNRACNTTITNLALDAAENIKTIRSFFPNVKIGDIEPLGSLSDGNLTAELNSWFSAFERATNRPLAFFHVDVMFGEDTELVQRTVYDVCQKTHVRPGYIFNGSPGAVSNLAWVATAKARARLLFSLNLHDIDVIVQDWNKFPTEYTPETSPESLAHFLRYVSRGNDAVGPPVDLILAVRKATPAQRDIFPEAAFSAQRQAEVDRKVRLLAYRTAIQDENLVGIHRLTKSVLARELSAWPDILLTTSAEEASSALAFGYADETILGYIYPPDAGQGRPLWRAYNPTTQRHLYTVFEDEYRHLVADSWKGEGVIGHFPEY